MKRAERATIEGDFMVGETRDWEWEIAFTRDGVMWDSALFESCQDARTWFTQFLRPNVLNREEKSMFYVRKYCTVDAFDFLDLDTSPCKIKVDAPTMHIEEAA